MGARVYTTDEMQSFECTDALDDEGYVLALGSNGKVSKCAAGAQPFGVAFKDTKDPITETPEANKQVAVICSGVVKVQYATDANAIAIGDRVATKGVATAGCVKKFIPRDIAATFADTDVEAAIDELKTIVGIALESAPANSTGKIKVALRLR